ncbi:MAG: 3-octaprenyl-4-hydroxybenzoate carboxy-lyase [Polaromonas sp.]|nr:3-octaprenyl-4-hydroxybenzoate carboxy-lyase [Polaromonas sp.]
MTLSFSFELPPAVRGSVSAAFTHTPAPRRIIVAISDASGAVYGARLLQVLQGTPGIESHLIVSEAGWHSIEYELDMDRDFIEDMAHQVHDMDDIGASLASASFGCSGMVIAPCSTGTLAALAHGLADNLLTRTADLMLRERRRLVLLVRESPLHLAHLRNMVSVTEMGGIICPPVPAFGLHPQTVGDIVNYSVASMLDLLDVPHSLTLRSGDVALAEAA